MVSIEVTEPLCVDLMLDIVRDCEIMPQ